MKKTTIFIVAVLLSACSYAKQPILERAALPNPPRNFGVPVPLPPVKKGESIKVFALKNRAAAIEANNRLSNDAAIYYDVLRLFGQ